MSAEERVRAKHGAATAADFASGLGAPLVMDLDTGALYALRDPDTVIEVGREGGWDDFLAPLSSGKIAGANTPTWAALTGGIYAYSFSATAMNELWVYVHIQHDYKAASMLYPHVHWTTNGTNNGVVRWGVEFTSARGYNVEAFPATQTVYIEQAASGVALRHMISEPAEGAGITIVGIEPDSIILMRIFRDGGHVNDTCTDAAFGLFCDIHYQSDGMRTNERNRTFTKKRGL